MPGVTLRPSCFVTFDRYIMARTLGADTGHKALCPVSSGVGARAIAVAFLVND